MYHTGMWLIGTQIVLALLLAILLVYELCANPDTVHPCKLGIIIALEVLDMLLEIAIVIISFYLFDEYNEHRNRTV